MVKLLGLGWAAWKLGSKRFGPAGGLVFALATLVGFTIVMRYLRRNHPNAARQLEQAA